MPTTKSVPAVKNNHRLQMPESVRDDPRGKAMWQWAVKSYRYQAADRLALTMLCHAWSDYCRHYDASRTETPKNATSPLTAMFDRVCKMMFCLGMMPSQRPGTAGGEGGGLETRGADGGLPGGDDFDGE